MYVSIPIPFEQELLKWNFQDYKANHYIFGKGGKPSATSWGSNYFSNKHREILLSLGYDTKRYKLYSWKNTGAINFIEAGGNLKELQMQMRHYSLDMTDKYLKGLGVMDSYNLRNNFPPI